MRAFLYGNFSIFFVTTEFSFQPSEYQKNQKTLGFKLNHSFLLTKFQAGGIWNKVFKSGLSKFCKREPLKNLKRYVLRKQTISLQFFFKAVFRKIYLVHS